MTVLDDLFNWAANQPTQNKTTVNISMATNQVIGPGGPNANLVSYATGYLTYQQQTDTQNASFTSTSPLTQYFSDRQYPGSVVSGPSIGGAPFNANATDQLNVTITLQPFLEIPRPPSMGPMTIQNWYYITLQSPTWGYTIGAPLNVDPATNIIYFMIGATYYTISLCNQTSTGPGG